MWDLSDVKGVTGKLVLNVHVLVMLARFLLIINVRLRRHRVTYTPFPRYIMIAVDRVYATKGSN